MSLLALTALIRGKICFSDLQKRFTEYYRNFKILLCYVFVTVFFEIRDGYGSLVLLSLNIIGFSIIAAII